MLTDRQVALMTKKSTADPLVVLYSEEWPKGMQFTEATFASAPPGEWYDNKLRQGEPVAVIEPQEPMPIAPEAPELPSEAEPEPPTPADLNAMRKAELVDVAVNLGAPRPSAERMSKGDLQMWIAANSQADDGDTQAGG